MGILSWQVCDTTQFKHLVDYNEETLNHLLTSQILTPSPTSHNFHLCLSPAVLYFCISPQCLCSNITAFNCQRSYKYAQWIIETTEKYNCREHWDAALFHNLSSSKRETELNNNWLIKSTAASWLLLNIQKYCSGYFIRVFQGLSVIYQGTRKRVCTQSHTDTPYESIFRHFITHQMTTKIKHVTLAPPKGQVGKQH